MRILTLNEQGVEVADMWDHLRKERIFIRGREVGIRKFQRMVQRMRLAGEIPGWHPKHLPTVSREAYHKLSNKAFHMGMSYRQLCCKILMICANEPNLIDNIIDGD